MKQYIAENTCEVVDPGEKSTHFLGQQFDRQPQLPVTIGIQREVIGIEELRRQARAFHTQVDLRDEGLGVAGVECREELGPNGIHAGQTCRIVYTVGIVGSSNESIHRHSASDHGAAVVDSRFGTVPMFSYPCIRGMFWKCCGWRRMLLHRQCVDSFYLWLYSMVFVSDKQETLLFDMKTLNWTVVPVEPRLTGEGLTLVYATMNSQNIPIALWGAGFGAFMMQTMTSYCVPHKTNTGLLHVREANGLVLGCSMLLM
ncbi:hypothetical protein SELMODRAFT_412147 [Selaginella moellendorffii]|uniref:Uncharacterized protein n=1 Tax=Selaginella moellendorffii TaxID=88036 RepID=D8RK77_SELML|nr:hypothetical protein SELMODRAFT_412147 [Selaginella moellendorffii]